MFNTHIYENEMFEWLSVTAVESYKIWSLFANHLFLYTDYLLLVNVYFLKHTKFDRKTTNYPTNYDHMNISHLLMVGSGGTGRTWGGKLVSKALVTNSSLVAVGASSMV